jgi:heterodisulfide reductase subunit C
MKEQREKKEKVIRKGVQTCWNCGSEMYNCKVAKTTVAGDKIWLCPECYKLDERDFVDYERGDDEEEDK